MIGTAPFNMPAGTILDFSGETAPAGYLLCDGAEVNRADYPKLFSAIGELWGAGDGVLTFNLPDFRRRTTIGAGGTATATIDNTVGSVGGVEAHTLTTAEMPSHSHTTPIRQLQGNGTYSPEPNGSTGKSTYYSTGSNGGGEAHNNMQPSAVVMKIIKV